MSYTGPHNTTTDPRLLDKPPGLPHHQDCPCCNHRQRLLWAIRTVDGMRGARIRDDIIHQQLERQGFNDYIIERALALTETGSPPDATPPPSHHTQTTKTTPQAHQPA